MIKEKMVNLLHAIYNLLKFYFTFIGQMDSLYVLHILMFFIMLKRQFFCVSGLIKHAFQSFKANIFCDYNIFIQL